jgi:hypothetical protein
VLISDSWAAESQRSISNCAGNPYYNYLRAENNTGSISKSPPSERSPGSPLIAKRGLYFNYRPNHLSPIPITLGYPPKRVTSISRETPRLPVDSSTITRLIATVGARSLTSQFMDQIMLSSISGRQLVLHQSKHPEHQFDLGTKTAFLSHLDNPSSIKFASHLAKHVTIS